MPWAPVQAPAYSRSCDLQCSNAACLMPGFANQTCCRSETKAAVGAVSDAQTWIGLVSYVFEQAGRKADSGVSWPVLQCSSRDLRRRTLLPVGHLAGFAAVPLHLAPGALHQPPAQLALPAGRAEPGEDRVAHPRLRRTRGGALHCCGSDVSPGFGTRDEQSAPATRKACITYGRVSHRHHLDAAEVRRGT